ncbi:MAG: tetratricopeptide repeat protein, partial [Nitrospirales bacterium]
FWRVGGEAYLDYVHGLYLTNRPVPQADDLERAVTYLEQSVRRDSSFQRARLALADAYVSLYDVKYDVKYLTEAQRYARSVLAHDTSNSTALSILGQVKYYVFEMDSARHFLTRALERNPRDVRALTISGSMVMYENQHEAIVRFERAREVEPRNATVISNLGIVQSMLRDFDNAQKTLQYAIELKPDDLVSWMSLGYTNEKLGKVDDARRCYLHVFTENAAVEQVYPLLFRLLITLHQYPLADSLTRQAIFLLPKSTYAQYYRGVVRARVGDERGAREAFSHGLDVLDEQLQQMSTSPDVSNYSQDLAFRGLFHARLGQRGEAKADLQRAISAESANHEAFM